MTGIDPQQASDSTDPRADGEGFLQSMGEIFKATEGSEHNAKPDQLLSMAMGKLQGLGLTAVYYELRHGHDQQQRYARELAEHTKAVHKLAESIEAHTELVRARLPEG